jgi:hypothetical protein
MSDCFVPLAAFAGISIMVVFAAMQAARSWSWPLLGYSIVGFVCMMLVCSFELTLFSWLMISLPIFAGLAALVWRHISMRIGPITTTTTVLPAVVDTCTPPADTCQPQPSQPPQLPQYQCDDCHCNSSQC